MTARGDGARPARIERSRQPNGAREAPGRDPLLRDREAREAEASRAVHRVTWWNVLVNASIGVLKGIAGVASGSSAMIADAVHSAASTYDRVYTQRPPWQGSTEDEQRIAALRAGLCFESLGRASEARLAYDWLLHHGLHRSAIVNLARARLGEMVRSGMLPPDASTVCTARTQSSHVVGSGGGPPPGGGHMASAVAARSTDGRRLFRSWRNTRADR